jgi:hypothetical protein
MTMQMYHKSTLYESAVTIKELRENFVKKNMITPVAAPFNIQSKNVGMLVRKLKDLVCLSYII